MLGDGGELGDGPDGAVGFEEIHPGEGVGGGGGVDQVDLVPSEGGGLGGAVMEELAGPLDDDARGDDGVDDGADMELALAAEDEGEVGGVEGATDPAVFLGDGVDGDEGEAGREAALEGSPVPDHKIQLFDERFHCLEGGRRVE